MPQETVQPTPAEQGGMSPEQQQAATGFTEDVKVASEGLHRAKEEKFRFNRAEMNGGVFAGLNLPGIAYVNANVGVNKAQLKIAERKAKRHYKKNEAAYQDQAVKDANDAGV